MSAVFGAVGSQKDFERKRKIMQIETLLEVIGADYFVGVPDSQLQALCNHLMAEYGIDPRHHLIAANEGNAVALAAGYHLATKRVPVVYLQNSGIGNIINPVASLLNDEVYGIPCLFIVGWRGEPGVHDEPQHRFQGKVTLKLLQDMDIDTFVLDGTTTQEELREKMADFRARFAQGKSAAIVVRKGALTNSRPVKYGNDYTLKREDAIRQIAAAAGEDPIVSTTGKASRELFEIREANGQGHKYDFLTVGSMGHSSSIALALAIQKPHSRIWCVDGDGAVLMHLGAMAVLGSVAPQNLTHIVINNTAHETVGGMPTVAGNIDLEKIAEGCGYKWISSVRTAQELDAALSAAKEHKGLELIEVRCALGARADLGRPTTTAQQNKAMFMEYLETLD